jgi:RluA family pseudouridine synthase
MMSEPLPFRVIFEDEHILAVEKPAGMVAHPVYKHPDGTLVDYIAAWRAARGLTRPWLLHRLDKDTSGVVLLAISPHTLRITARQFSEHTVRKSYIALAWGADLPDAGTITAPLGRDPDDRRRMIVRDDGQAAETHYEVLARSAHHALLRLRPTTGRMHQLRAHLAHLGHPIAGDPVYAHRGADIPVCQSSTDIPICQSETDAPACQSETDKNICSPDHLPAARLLLHAEAITLRIPSLGGARARTFLAPLPHDFLVALRDLEISLPHRG